MMKRILAVLLVFAMLLPVCAAAEDKQLSYFRMFFRQEYNGRTIVHGDEEALRVDSQGTGNSGGRWYFRYIFDRAQLKTSGPYTYMLLEDGTAALLAIDESRQNETLEIPSAIDGYTVTRLGVDVNTGSMLDFDNFLSRRVKKIVFPDTLKVVSAGLLEDSSIKQLTFPEGVEEIGSLGRLWAFNISKITLPKKSLRVLGDFAFAGTEMLASVTLPEGLTDIGFGAFMDSSLKSVTIPSSVTSLGDYLCYRSGRLAKATLKEGLPCVTEGMFLNCPKLASISVPSTAAFIGAYAFEDCVKLSKVTLKEGALTEIGEAAFRRCTALSKITIPNGVTSIGADAFYGCSKLSSVTLPASVTSIGDYAFDDCGKKLTFTVAKDSYAHQWATDNGYKVKLAKTKK